MSRRKKNAGEGYGVQFHGNYASKQDAVKKERKVHGWIKPTTISGKRRYMVMSERKNPIKRKNLFGFGKRERKPKLFGPKEGDLVKVVFSRKGQGERIWVRVTGKRGSRYTGILDNEPVVIKGHLGSRVSFAKKQIVSRMNPENPSELLVLGANPVHKELVLDPHTTYTIRTNPSAAAIREDFVGAPSDGYTTYNVPGMPAGDYAQLGELLSLYVKPTLGGQVREIRFTKPRPVLVSDTTRRQLYFVGGDQDVSSGLDAFTDQTKLAMIELGECRRIDYKQRKEHVPEPEIDEWKHQFGEETGVKPTLWFDATSKQLFLKGGEYEVRPEGITN